MSFAYSSVVIIHYFLDFDIILVDCFGDAFPGLEALSLECVPHWASPHCHINVMHIIINVCCLLRTSSGRSVAAFCWLVLSVLSFC